jgi:glycosyltransferase involved in cell wall biosynthesis
MIIAQTDKYNNSAYFLSKFYNYIKLKSLHAITKWSIRYVYKRSDNYVLLSKGFIPILVKYAHLKDFEKVCAIGNAIGFSSDGFSYNFKDKQKQILYVGRMDPFNKRVNRIVETWEVLYKKYPEWSLVLVGEGPQLQSLKDYVKTRKIEHVYFYGFQKEPPRNFYEKASVLMLTSDLEGFGLVIIEGMQFGVVPIVYGSYVAVYDIIDNGKDGFITPVPYSKEKTVECLEKLIINDRMRDQMASAAINKAADYSLDMVARKWYDLFL